MKSLCGKLSWANVVNVFGRSHLAPFLNLIWTLKAANHKSRLSDLIVEELNWWLACLNSGNNTKDIWDKCPCLVIATDASQVGGGAFCQCGDSLYLNFILDRPMLAYQHISIKELAMVKEAVHYWAPQFEGHHFSILTDNQAEPYMINKGYSKHHIATTLLQEIALISQRFNCNVSASYIPGVLNDIPDAISRFHQFGQYERFVKLVNQLHTDQTRFKRCTISPISHLFIFQRHQINSAVWTKKWQHWEHTHLLKQKREHTRAAFEHTSSFAKLSSCGHSRRHRPPCADMSPSFARDKAYTTIQHVSFHHPVGAFGTGFSPSV